MGFYDKINNSFNKISETIYIERTKFGEKQSIKKKKSFYSDVVWTQDEKRLFDDYWMKSYGKIIPDSWHKMYQKMSGVFHENYFPEFLFSTKLEPLINNKKYCEVFADKSLLYSLFSDIDGIRPPKAFVINTCGNYFDGNMDMITKEDAVKVLNNIGSVLFKATVDSSGGKSIIIADFENGKDKKTGLTPAEIFDKYGKNFIAQERLLPSKELAGIYPLALNTFRIITYRAKDHYGSCPVAMRMGAGGMNVDNITSGGLCVGVSDDGHLKKYASNTRYGEVCNQNYTSHPDTGTVFEGYLIPQIPKMIELAKTMHKKTPQVGIISWDLSVNDKNEIIIVEANFFDQSAWFPQIINGEPLFKEDTEYMLSLIRND